MADSLPMEKASTIQSASITKSPDLRHDLNPSTSVVEKEPVSVSQPSSSEYFEDEDGHGIDGNEEEDEEDESGSIDDCIIRDKHFRRGRVSFSTI